MAPCEIWWATPIHPERAPHLVSPLDPLERARLGRLLRQDDRARFVAAHALARFSLALVLDVPAESVVIDRTCRCGSAHGKPRVAGGPEFSLTHSGDLVGVAVSEQPVGLDVEQIRHMHDLAGVAAAVCSATESTTGDEDFFRLWTRKEALLKATGDGLLSPMAAITLDDHGVRTWAGSGAPTVEVWCRELRPDRRHAAAVAGLGPAPVCVEGDGNALLR